MTKKNAVLICYLFLGGGGGPFRRSHLFFISKCTLCNNGGGRSDKKCGKIIVILPRQPGKRLPEMATFNVSPE